MKYKIVDLETGREWFTNNEAEAYRLSFEIDRYDVEILEDDDESR